MKAVHSPVRPKMNFLTMYKDIYKQLPEWRRTRMMGHVTALDATVGKVVEIFKRYGFWENTILIFTSDNGANLNKGGFNGRLSGHKGKG